jgi:hypothetical protein
LRVLALALFSVALVAAAASAHEGAEPFILVPGDHIVPGQPFEVIASDLAPNSTIEITLAVDERVDQLDEVVSGADGHFSTTVTVPDSFPVGYAQIFAIDADGSEASTWVLVGERNDQTPAIPTSPTADWWTDPSVIVLGVVVGSALISIGALIIRSQSRGARRERSR